MARFKTHALNARARRDVTGAGTDSSPPVRPNRDVRRELIERHLDVSRASMLEIGALDAPTYRADEANIRFLDYAATDELAESQPSQRRYQRHRLVEVDYVCPTPRYSEVIADRFDLIIANHVIEHIPDTIRWLEELDRLLTDDGLVLLSVPDQRYTFDIARPPTTFVDVLRYYHERVEKPSFYDILEHRYFHKSIKAADVWTGVVDQQLRNRRYDPQTAIELAEREARQPYADAHCHVYTRDSFLDLFTVLGELRLSPLEIREADEVAYGTNEFRVVLQRTAAD